MIFVLLAFCIVGQDIPVFEPIEDRRIGTVSGPGEYVLTEVSAVALDAGGNVWVGQPQDRRVSIYDSTGYHVAWLGREGAGPGEFRTITDVYTLGDSVLVTDAVLGRTTVFVNRKVVDTWPPFFPPDSYRDYRARPPAAVFSDGSVVMIGAGLARQQTEEMHLFRIGPDPRKTAVLAVLESDGRSVMATDPERGLRFYFQAPVSESDLWAPVPERNLVAVIKRDLPRTEREQATAVIELLAHTGEVVHRMRLADEPRTVPRDAYARQSRLVAADLAATGIPVAERVLSELAAEAMPKPPFQPLIDRVIPTAEALWLRRGSFGMDEAEWFILSLNGAPQGTVRLPEGSIVMEAGNDFLWTAEQGDFDEVYLVRYRLQTRKP